MNPERANYCENCGSKLDILSISSTQTQQKPKSLLKLKSIVVILLVLNLILSSGLLYYYNACNRLNIENQTLANRCEYLSSINEQLESLIYTLNQEKSKVDTWYGAIRDEINLRKGLGENKKRFITPDHVSVRELVTEVTGGWGDTSNWDEYWSDLRKMYDWVTKNVDGSYDSPTPTLPSEFGGAAIVPPEVGSLEWTEECFRFPKETITSKHGDCEDQGVLLASMILNYVGKRYTVWAIEWISGHICHIAVALPVSGGKISILDPAGRFYIRNQYGDLGPKDAASAANEWLDYWNKQGYGNAKIDLVFSDTEYKGFSSTQEFTEYARSNAHAVSDTLTHVEKIDIKNVNVVNAGTDFIVYMDYINEGPSSTIIDSILLNGVSYSDYSPQVGVSYSDYSPQVSLYCHLTTFSSICEPGELKLGEIMFRVGAIDPSGNQLTKGITLTITLHTTGEMDYSTSVVLP